MRRFDASTTWSDVSDMTVEEAISILSKYAKTDGRDWSARPHMARACQIAIIAMRKMKEAK